MVGVRGDPESDRWGVKAGENQTAVWKWRNAEVYLLYPVDTGLSGIPREVIGETGITLIGKDG